ncbi:uncharacterized protein LOC112555958 [Pomacea canaliculata]|uniref:uncharacterized protein LOC112555958 n=1 Tax=Pomacea canaliculata TaxID=400727 RepID=UPI000D7366CE|nr:uncharacterized protein LOC112555958 [Pomacea canaliculata]
MNKGRESPMSTSDTIASRLRYWSVTSPETMAFIYVTPEGERYAYSRREFFSWSRRAASWLRSRGMRKRDVILCLLSNSPEETFITMGATLLGATVIVARMQFQDGSDLVPVLTLGDVTTIVLDPRDTDIISGLKNHIPNLSGGEVTADAFPALRTVICCNRNPEGSGELFLESICREQEAEPEDISPDDPAHIFLTSGSTGQSKLVLRTHKQVLALGPPMCESYGCKPGDVLFSSNFFGWVTGYPSSYFFCGITRVTPYIKGSQPKDELKFLLDVMSKEKATHVLTLPQVAKKFLTRTDLLTSHLTWRARAFIFGGSPVRKDVAGILGTLTSELRVSCGTTETGFNLYKSYTDPEKVESFNCGKPVQGVQVKVVDQNLQEVPPDTKGELMIMHNNVFPGYLKQQSAAATPEPGWFKSGDLAYVTDEGDVCVEGRQTEAITVGTWTLYPQPLETSLLTCPGVHEVAVVAIPDKDFGSRPCACVVPDPRPEVKNVVPEAVLRLCSEFFRESFLQEYKQESSPIKNCLLFDQFPVNSSGKVQRSLLRTLARERLGL